MLLPLILFLVMCYCQYHLLYILCIVDIVSGDGFVVIFIFSFYIFSFIVKCFYIYIIFSFFFLSLLKCIREEYKMLKSCMCLYKTKRKKNVLKLFYLFIKSCLVQFVLLPYIRVLDCHYIYSMHHIT